MKGASSFGPSGVGRNLFKSAHDCFINWQVIHAFTFASVGGIGLLWQFGGLSTREFLLVVLCSSLILALLGALILRQVIELSQLSSEYIRAHNRIRRFYILRYPFINRFVRLPSDHRFPPFYYRSSSRPLVEAVNSLLLAVAVICSLAMVSSIPTPQTIHIAVGVVFFLVVFLIQELYCYFHALSEQKKSRQYEEVSLESSESVYPTYRNTMFGLWPGYLSRRARQARRSNKATISQADNVTSATLPDGDVQDVA